MAQYRYTADNRSALRAAVTSSPLWDSYRQRNGLSSSSLSVDDLEEAAKAASGPRKGRRAVSIPAMWTHGKSKRKGV